MGLEYEFVVFNGPDFLAGEPKLCIWHFSWSLFCDSRFCLLLSRSKRTKRSRVLYKLWLFSLPVVNFYEKKVSEFSLICFTSLNPTKPLNNRLMLHIFSPLVQVKFIWWVLGKEIFIVAKYGKSTCFWISIWLEKKKKNLLVWFCFSLPQTLIPLQHAKKDLGVSGIIVTYFQSLLPVDAESTFSSREGFIVFFKRKTIWT